MAYIPTPETRAKISASKKGKPSNRKGVVLSVKTKKKISESLKIHKNGWKNPAYGNWMGMIQRCYNPRSDSYYRYGGRGIKVCDRWLNGTEDLSGFDCFVLDMGPRPSKRHQIDRYPNNDGDYEPGNCRWATKKQQGWSEIGKKASAETRKRISAGGKGRIPWNKGLKVNRLEK